METTCNPDSPKPVRSGNGLYSVVNKLAVSFSDKAYVNRNVFENLIPDQVTLYMDPQKISYVLSGLLSAVVCNTTDSSIKLSAKIYGNVILFQLKNSSAISNDVLTRQVQQLQPFAENLRGSVSVTSKRNNLTTVTFGFPNLPC